MQDERTGDGLEVQERLAGAMMRRQAALSMRVAMVFVLLLLGLPLVNWLLPTVANANVMGFTASWLFLGVLFYPITWFLSGWFVRASDRIEAEIVQESRAVAVEGEGR